MIRFSILGIVDDSKPDRFDPVARIIDFRFGHDGQQVRSHWANSTLAPIEGEGLGKLNGVVQSARPWTWAIRTGGVFTSYFDGFINHSRPDFATGTSACRFVVNGPPRSTEKP